MSLLDSLAIACLAPLAVFCLISGLDDLVLDLALAVLRLRRGGACARGGESAGTNRDSEKRIAVFIPLWREHRVIGRMLEHNLAAIRYRNYEVFVGAYPNDEPTLDAVRSAEARYPNVHLAICPHDGPTSKADCLNWIFQRMLIYEEEHADSFEIVVTHDAEDLVHPDSFAILAENCDTCGMVQIPVLPLPTPFCSLTHGVYCDEFAEFQTKDLAVRQMLGGFLPSNGVGTGYSRDALEKLAEVSSNRVFEPGCLTEDYENGLRLHRLGFRQMFVPLRPQGGHPLATREFFPASFGQAVKQRARWVIGIALQGWERHGWQGGLAVKYWFWRDRKGLLGNPASVLANVIFLYGLLSWLYSRGTGEPWEIGRVWQQGRVADLLLATLAIQALRLLVRAGCVARIYGGLFALGVPLRMVWANWLNAAATILALVRYAAARFRRVPLVWLKTEHLFPSREALSLSLHVPVEAVGLHEVSRPVVRSLPARVVRRWRVLPVKVESGCLVIAGAEPPTKQMQRELRRCTNLELRFRCVTPGNYELLWNEFFESAAPRHAARDEKSRRAPFQVR